MGLVQVRNVSAQRQVFRAAATSRPHLGRVKTAATYFEHAAQNLDRMLVAVFLNAGVLYSFIRFKYASNFFRISYSSLTRASSRRKRTTSRSSAAALRPR